MEEPDWQIPARLQPLPERYPFDLLHALRAVVGLRAQIPPDAFTAPILGTERTGNGVLIREDGLVLTIGYLITEAETVWLTTADGGGVPAHVVGIDQATGFGLVQALGRIRLPALEIGDSASLGPGMPVLFAASGGRHHALEAHVVGRDPFAGYWEYLLERPLFTAPAHPFWGGAALVDGAGKLVGIGSLVVQRAEGEGRQADMNMVVPIELLPPILEPMMATGRSPTPPRPWLGIYCGEMQGVVIIRNIAPGGPAEKADLRPGDHIVAVGDTEIGDLAGLWRAVWASGDAGVPVKLSIARGRQVTDIIFASADRAAFLKRPKLH